MTTPNRQLPQVKNNVQEDGAKLVWYRSSIVWLGIVLTAFIFVGCVHFLYLGAQLRSQENTQNTAVKKKELTHVLGVPISSSPAKKSEKTTDDSL